jgi:two-component system sensor histidine kinase/response regulator
VELMNGEISIESAVGHGTTFHFTANVGIQKSPAPKHEVHREYLQGLHVLVVDDNETNRLILHEQTSAWGMNPVVVESVDAAIQAMERARNAGSPIKLVLTDMYMPKRDGLELIEWIRGRQDFANANVIILSSGPTAEHRARAEELKVSAYLTKPVRQSLLLDAIADVTGPADEIQTRPVAQPASDVTFDQPLKILLAEDNQVNQLTATTMLEKLGHSVVVANNGREAIEKLGEQEFDLVFMDVQMPELDGMAATGEIRESEQATGKHIPIVAMTAHAMQGDREKCLESGMDDYISKPIRRKELASVLNAVAQKFLVTEQENQETTEEVEMADSTALDEVALMEECDDDKEFLARMVEIFDRDSSERMPKLQDAIKAGDSETVSAEAHALKGGLGNFFAAASFETAHKLEMMGRDGNLDEAEDTFQRLERELKELRDALGALLKS